MADLYKMRAGQRNFFKMVGQHRLLGLLARRQYGKTTLFSKIALHKMMKERDHTIIFGSAKINLSREIVRAEASVIQAAIRTAIQKAEKGALRIIDADNGNEPDLLTHDDFAELYEAQRLEFRWYHTRQSYSRTKVVALLPDTVGETGDLMCDEIGRVKNWDEVWEAASPIIASNPDYRMLLATTIPPDDTHFSWEMLVEPAGTDFTPKAEGNHYVSDWGMNVLRVDAWDAYEDGVPIYDLHTGDALDPDESRKREQHKEAWDRNYGLKFLIGGAAACGLIQLDNAQRRGAETCAFFNISSDEMFDKAIEWITENCSDKAIGIGDDPATTTKKKSNPTAIAIVEDHINEYITRCIITWKTADPAIADERIDRIVKTVSKRKAGGRAKGLAIDATNERYWAAQTRDRLRGDLPVSLIVGSENYDGSCLEKMTTKQYLGGHLIATLNDNKLTLPPDRYIRDDWRLVKKDRGLIVCDPDSDGKHGDTFDAVKLAIEALSSGGPAEAEAVPVSSTTTDTTPKDFMKPDHSDDH